VLEEIWLGLRSGRVRIEARVGPARAAALSLALVLGSACGEIPPFPGTGQGAGASTPAARPTPLANLQRTAEATAGASQPAAPQATTAGATSTPSGPLAALATLVPAIPTGLPNLLERPTATPVPTPAPGTGASSPEAAIQRAFEAAADGDEQALKSVSDPAVHENPLPFLEMLGRGDRKLTLTDMQYRTIQNDGSFATVRVTGRIGNIPLLGERSIDEKETAKRIGGAWYLSRSTDSGGQRR
jgi:hypothetical protein